jgi:hypothetical protein
VGVQLKNWQGLLESSRAKAEDKEFLDQIQVKKNPA